MTNVIFFKKYKNQSQEREKEGKTLRDQLKIILLLIELKRHQGYKTLHEILEEAKRQNISLESDLMQQYLKNLYKEISPDPNSQNKSPITLDLFEEAFQKLDIFIGDYNDSLKKLEQQLS